MVAPLGLGRWDVAKQLHDPVVVEVGDPFDGGQFERLGGATRA